MDGICTARSLLIVPRFESSEPSGLVGDDVPTSTGETRPRPDTNHEESFAVFYAQNIEKLSKSLTATLGCPLKAQDAAQEAMLKAYKRWDKISTYANPMGWCYRVAVNSGRSSWRKFGREQLTDTIGTVPTNDVIESIDTDLLSALLKLPMSQRSVVVLRVFMGWSIQETADALGIAPGTVSSRYARAMSDMRRRVSSTSGPQAKLVGEATT